MSPELDPLLNHLAEQIANRLLERLQPAAASEQGDESPWLNAGSAAAYLDWPVQRLYKLTAQNAIPHYKHDGRLLFNRQELDHWLQDFRQPGDWLTGEKRAISD